MTFCGAVHAIVHAGHVPVLTDIDPVTLLVTPATVAESVRRVGGVDAMVILHYAGYPAPVSALAEAAELPLARVVEDAAHALGTSVDDVPVGSISAATCFSFYATKNLPIGEGGMVTTDDEELADTVGQMRLHGMSRDAWKRYLPGASWRYDVDTDGIKANMTDVQAAVGRAQLGSSNAGRSDAGRSRRATTCGWRTFPAWGPEPAVDRAACVAPVCGPGRGRSRLARRSDRRLERCRDRDARCTSSRSITSRTSVGCSVSSPVIFQGPTTRSIESCPCRCTRH